MSLLLYANNCVSIAREISLSWFTFGCKLLDTLVVPQSLVRHRRKLLRIGPECQYLYVCVCARVCTCACVYVCVCVRVGVCICGLRVFGSISPYQWHVPRRHSTDTADFGKLLGHPAEGALLYLCCHGNSKSTKTTPHVPLPTLPKIAAKCTNSLG